MAPVLRSKTMRRDSSRFSAGVWAIKDSGKLNLNCDNFMPFF